MIRALAARAWIRELEESPEWIQPRASRQARPRPSNAATEILRLAKRYGLVSRETSYVAVEERDNAAPADVQLRRIPIALTHGWGGMDRERMAPLRAAVDPTSFVDYEDEAPAARLEAPLMYGLRVRPGAVARRAAGSPPSSMPPPSRPATALGSLWSSLTRHTGRDHADHQHRERMLAVVTLQRADGTWESCRDLADATGFSYDAFLEGYNDALSSFGLTDSRVIADAWATAIACAWLELRAASLEQEWRMVASKGRGAIDRALDATLVAGWLTAARDTIAK